MAKSVQQAAKEWKDAQHVAQQVGGRAAAAELERARTALSQSAGVRRSR